MTYYQNIQIKQTKTTFTCLNYQLLTNDMIDKYFINLLALYDVPI